ncbi:MAG: metallophosphatase family protein, partial [Gammaproteobacteria bacterium]|nr:metallophosphatase family protein [Gammaproteobacteria bacterium]
KVCILSDSHDNRRLLGEAVEDAKARGAEAVLHCGDVVAPTTLRVLRRFELPVHVIHGNNTGDLYAMSKLSHESDSVVRYYGQDAVLHLAGRATFLVHYPHYAAAMALTGDYDLVCCGHDHRASIHQVSNVKGGITLLLNPGTVGGVGARPTYILADLATLQFEIREVPTAPGEACNTPPVTVHES